MRYRRDSVYTLHPNDSILYQQYSDSLDKTIAEANVVFDSVIELHQWPSNYSSVEVDFMISNLNMEVFEKHQSYFEESAKVGTIPCRFYTDLLLKKHFNLQDNDRFNNYFSFIMGYEPGPLQYEFEEKYGFCFNYKIQKLRSYLVWPYEAFEEN